MFAVGLGAPVNSLFAATTMAISVPTGIKIFNWLGTMWGGRLRFATPMLFSTAFLFQFLMGGLTGVMLAVVPFDWQVSDSYFVVAHFHYVLIGGLVFLFFAAIYYWFPKATGRMLDERLGRWHFWLFVVGFNVTMGILHFAGLGMPSGSTRSDWSRLGYHQPRRLSGGHPPGRRCPPARDQHRGVPSPRRARWRRPLGRVDPGVGDHVTPSGVQLRDSPGGAESAAPVGSQASGRPGLEVRVTPAGQAAPEWRLPSRGRAGMIALIVMESAFLGTFVVAYLFYIGKSLSGPTPRQVLDFPLLSTVCLLASSVTVAIAVRALRRGRLPLVVAWLLVTILLGAAFLAGTAVEWYGLIVRDGFTIGTNLFGTTFYSLVGFHAGHVTLGLLLLILVWIFAVFGAVRAEHTERVELMSWYWHFVDAVWIVVLTVVYIVSR
jgi:heme/copper-type cytochrome/quinol oxidase subunit 3